MSGTPARLATPAMASISVITPPGLAIDSTKIGSIFPATRIARASERPSAAHAFGLQAHGLQVIAHQVAAALDPQPSPEMIDKVELTLPMKPRLIEANPRVEEVRNHLAVMRGPVVYCMESVDLSTGVKLSEVRLPRRIQLTTAREKGRLGDVVVVKGIAARIRQPDWDQQLYRDFAPSKPEKLPITFIPYYAWANRGVAEMSVWLPAE